MSRVVAVANQKGGTGKTTTAINLGGALAEYGQKMLLVDLDPQASLSLGLGVSVSDLDRTIYDVMVDEVPLKDVLLSVRETIDLAPANIYLSAAEVQLAGEIRREDRLRNSLAPVKEAYDFVLVDCPPSLGLLTINAFSAADSVLVPMSCDYYSMAGVRLLLDTIERMRNKLNPSLEILGVLPTRFDRRTRHAHEVLEATKARLGERGIRVFDTVIRETVRFKEQAIESQTITEYMSDHPGAEDYRQVAREILDE